MNIRYWFWIVVHPFLSVFSCVFWVIILLEDPWPATETKLSETGQHISLQNAIIFAGEATVGFSSFNRRVSTIFPCLYVETCRICINEKWVLVKVNTWKEWFVSTWVNLMIKTTFTMILFVVNMRVLLSGPMHFQFVLSDVSWANQRCRGRE